MGNLIRAELFKLKKSTAYRLLLVLYFMIEVAVQRNNISNSVHYPKYNPAYTGAEWLQSLDQTHLLYGGVLFLFTAFYMNGDFTAHTFYSGLLCGVPRGNAFLAKMISLFAGIIPLMFTDSLPGTVLWSIHSGFGMDFGIGAVLLVAKVFASQTLVSLVLVSHAVLFAVIAKSRIGAFGLGFFTTYAFGVLRGNIGNIVQDPVFSKFFVFLLSIFYYNLGTVLASILLKLLAAGYLFVRLDLR